LAFIGYLIEVRPIAWLAAVVLFFTPFAAANDTLATLGAGGLIPVKSAQIAMEREDLEISVHQITVHYLFRNHTDKDVDATVAFPLPELEGGTVEHVPLQLPSKDPANFVDFQVSAAGKAIAAKMDVRAFHEGRDITERLRAAGLPVSVSDPHFADAVARLSPTQRKQFEKDELVVSDDPAGTPNRRYWPYWTTRVQFYWTQHFPAHATVDVLHKYRPVVGGSYLVSTDDGASHIKPYCGGPDALPRIQAVKKRHPGKSQDEPVLFEKRINYILTTANNWLGPIRDFRLVVTADSPDDVVLTCFPGLKQAAPTRYELTRSNFHPGHDLQLLLLQTAR
jgi:hypothetical protein